MSDILIEPNKSITENIINQDNNDNPDTKSIDLNMGKISWKWYSIPMMALSAAINFIILSIIFGFLIYFREKAQYESGDISKKSYTSHAIWKGLLLGLLAAGIIFITDLMTGGFMTLVMFIVYPAALIGMLLLSIWNPAALNDINILGGKSRTSAFKYFSISFWACFAVGFVVAISLGLFSAYLGYKLSDVILNAMSNLMNGNSSLEGIFQGILGKQK